LSLGSGTAGPRERKALANKEGPGTTLAQYWSNPLNPTAADGSPQARQLRLSKFFRIVGRPALLGEYAALPRVDARKPDGSLPAPGGDRDTEPEPRQSTDPRREGWPVSGVHLPGKLAPPPQITLSRPLLPTRRHLRRHRGGGCPLGTRPPPWLSRRAISAGIAVRAARQRPKKTPPRPT
jgi:hypothetical protein